MSEPLKVCPFCGKKPAINPAGASVFCDNPKCPVTVETYGFDTESEAIAAWNRRAS